MKPKESQSMPLKNLSALGSRGLVVYSEGEGYKYKTEQDWRNAPYLRHGPPPKVETDPLLARLAEGTYVDLDQMVGLDDPTTEVPPDAKAGAWLENNEHVVLRENNKYFQVPLKAMKPIESGAEGDAGVVVNRGAVVAAIPGGHIPSGTYCVLVNLSSLKD